MSEKAKYVIWLPLWYPNRTEPFSGDFIMRHALAASEHIDIRVVVAIRDTSLKKGSTEVTERVKGRLTEIIIYYNTVSLYPAMAERLISFSRYCRVVDKCIKALIQIKGFPVAIHAHVFGKNCYSAFRWHRKLNIPLYYSEHSTGFLEGSDTFSFREGGILRLLLKKFIDSTSGISFVSEYLASSVKKMIPSLKYSIIPNVVDDSFFKPAPKAGNNFAFRFIHISTLSYQKNFEAVIQAFQQVSRTTQDYELIVFGSVTGSLREKVREVGLEGNIFFKGEQPHEKILPFLQASDALILYSRFETFGCVVIEANACGIPVVVSDIPVMRELVTEGDNGIIVPGDDYLKLAEALLEFIRNPLRPDKERMHRLTADKYGMKNIGGLLESLYLSV